MSAPLTPEEEKRRLARISNHFFVRSAPAGVADGESEKTAGIVHDIHTAGLSFVTASAYEEGQELDLEIELAGVKDASRESRGLLNLAAVSVRAEVLRTEELETGLYRVAALFENPDDEDRELIRRAISLVEP